MKLVTASLVGLLVATPLAAQEPQPGERPREHLVRRTDTLWDLAAHYYSNPWNWPRIYEANVNVVEDPHWIYPAEVLIIPGLYDPEDPTPPPTVAMRPLDRPVRTVFYREPVETRFAGDQPTVLLDEGMEAMPVLPGEFHSAEFIGDPDDLPVLGRMVESARMVDVRGQERQPTAHPMDRIFIGYASRERPEVGSRVAMVRVGRDFDEGGRGARVIHPTAIVRVLGHNEDVMEGQIINQFEAVDLDQLVLPLDMFPDFMGQVAEPVEGQDLEGALIEFVREQALYGHTDRGFLDVGAADGVRVGDVFIAYLPQRPARDRDPTEFRRYIERLPPEAVAELRIVRVTANHATFQVDRVVLPVLEDGMRVRRIRRMP